MEELCLENHFVFEIFFVGGFSLKEESELGFLYNKGIIYGFNYVIVLYIFLFFLILSITIPFLLYIIHMVPYTCAALKRG
jgi:hypothetical protein